MRRKLKFSVGEFYHLYSRGIEKKSLFLDKSDWDRFLRLLFVSNAEKPLIYKGIQGLSLDEIERKNSLIDIGAYCLMPNHFHLLVHEKTEKGITQFMGKLLTAYSMYFNKRYNRTGHLFEGTFRASHVNEDQYLKYLFTYIHLNPLAIIDSEWKKNGIKNKTKAFQHLQSYPYSSYLDYHDAKRVENIILNKKAFPEYFTDTFEFDKEIQDWLMFAENENKNPIQGLALDGM